MPELLVVSTTAGLDARDLVRGLERALAGAGDVAAAPGLLTAAADGTVRDAARARGAVVCVLTPAGPDLATTRS